MPRKPYASIETIREIAGNRIDGRLATELDTYAHERGAQARSGQQDADQLAAISERHPAVAATIHDAAHAIAGKVVSQLADVQSVLQAVEALQADYPATA